jgi:uncharacterized protein (TIGR03663 family)
MGTRKSRSQAGNAVRPSSPAIARVAGQANTRGEHQQERSRPEVSEGVWQGAGLLIIIVATVLRLYDHALKPLHHDEGVNGFFLQRLFREGIYQYDPANYHGPTLYYFALLTSKVFGLNTFAVRLVPALFGIGTVWLILCLRRYLGGIAALSAAALIAVSPGAVYLSRYFIHESQFVFFTLAIVVAALRFYDDADPVYLLMASASAALLFATKETAIISAGVLLIALLATHLYMSPKGIYARLKKAFNGQAREEEWRTRSRKAPPRAVPATQGRRLRERFGGAPRIWLLSLSAVAFFVLLNVLFYSSFFSHSKGVADAIGTFKFWTETSKSAHVQAWYMYLWWLWQEEAPLLVLGAAGVVLAAVRADNRFVVFTALWALGITAAYSLVPYKTPWLTLNLIVPLAIIGGYAVSLIYRWDESPQPIALAVVLAVALGIGGYQTVKLNFYHYDDDRYPYVYAHTRREFLSLVDEIKRLAARAGTGEQTTIAVTSPDYWPMPWYLRDYKRVGYHSRISVAGEAIVVGSATQESELRTALGDQYQRVDSYALRPGVVLVLYVRRDAAAQ